MIRILRISSLILSFVSIAVYGEQMSDERIKVNWHKEVITGPLQKEIDHLAPNETLTLKSGQYLGPIHIRTNGITIESDGIATITANNNDSVIIIEADNVTIKNLKITGSGQSYTQADAGIGVRKSNNVRILDNIISDCLFGIDVYEGKNLLIQNNTISSKNLEIGLRGDAMRLYAVTDSKVLANKWSHSRDVVSWYSKRVEFKKNEGSDSRYSIHSMYSQNLKIQDNIFKRNRVGIFLMYGSNFIVTNNHIERALGATGMGIGLKESSDIIAQNNTILYSAVGVLVDNSPFKTGSRNWFHNNKLAFNGKGVVVSNDLRGGEFKRNIFIGNLLDVESENRKGSRSLWDGNTWDKYIGFDQDQDFIGDTPYIIKKYSDTVISGQPKTSFFFMTPILSLIGFMEKIVGTNDPIIILEDKNPRLLED